MNFDLNSNFLKNLSKVKIFLNLRNWKEFWKILTKKEKKFLSCFIILAFASFSFLVINFYFKNTKIEPNKSGIYTEGFLGQPRFINPVYADNSDIDRDLVQLIFSGLMKYDIDGKIIPDLVQKIEIKENGRVYEFYLKENLFWQDGRSLTADDVVFTVKTIQNPEIKSALFANWIGVEVEKIDNLRIRFVLKEPYAGFLEKCTLKIIPEHIWKDISPQNFSLAVYNLKPVGSGLYRLKEIKQDKTGYIKNLILESNSKYFGFSPFISRINFSFFEKQEDLIRAVQKKEIKGFSTNTKEFFKIKNSVWKKYNEYHLSLPRIFAVFFNPQKSKVLSEKNVRIALNYGVNKKEIIEKIFDGNGKTVESPFLSDIFNLSLPVLYGFNPEKAIEILEKADFLKSENNIRKKKIEKKSIFQFKKDLSWGSRGLEVEELQKCLANPLIGGPEIYPQNKINGYFDKDTKAAVIKFQEKYAKEILEPFGFKKGTGLISQGTRKKLNEICFEKNEKELPLKFTLITVSQPILEKTALLLKKQWAELGAEVEVKTMDIVQLEKEIIKPRNYEALLFGEILNIIPDPFPFWHSSQRKDPGLNLAIYENKESDKLLEEIRKSGSDKERKEKLEKFQEVLIKDAPAVFLYTLDYLYFLSKEVKGMNTKIIADPSKRFIGIENWYIKTRRVWK